MEEDKRNIENDEHVEDRSSRELDNLILSPPKGRQTPWKRLNTRGKSLSGFVKQQVDWNLNVTNIPAAAALDKLLGKFFKDVHKQNGGMYEPDIISSFEKAYSSYLRCARLSLSADCLSPKALQSRFSSQAMPLLSKRQQTSAEFQSVFNLVKSTPNEPRSSFCKHPNWILDGRRSLSYFRLHFIYSFEVDIEQS